MTQQGNPEGKGSKVELRSLENHELSLIMRQMSASGQQQLLRTILKPEAAEALSQIYATTVQPSGPELMMTGNERKMEVTLINCGLLGLFQQTQKFEGYAAARESCKRAMEKLSLLKQAKTLVALKPGTPEFDVELFFFDMTPGNYEKALILNQGTVADAAGRGDLEFFKRLYNKVKNDQAKKAGGQYEHFLVMIWLHGFLWLMPDQLACRVVANRMSKLFEYAESEGLPARKTKEERKLDYATRAGHEAQRKRFREAVKSLELYQHPERPVVEIKVLAKGEPNSNCYVWKSGWPK